MRPHRSHSALIYGLTGQTVSFYPPADEVLADGAPTAAATYRVFAGSQMNDDTPKITGTATLDSVSTTTDETSGPSRADRSVVYLTSTSNIMLGRRYLLTCDPSLGSYRQVVVPKSLNSGVSVQHQNDLYREFSSNSTFVGLRQSFVIDSTFIQTVANINIFGGTVGRVLLTDSGDSDTIAPPYRVEWSYSTAGGIARKHWSTFDVCRAPLKHQVSIDHVKASMPDIVWQEWVQQSGQDFQPQIDDAFERVKLDIRAAGYDPNAVYDPQVVDRLVTLASRAGIAAALNKDGDGKIEAAYVNLFARMIGVALRTWISVDSSGSVAINPARQLMLTR